LVAVTASPWIRRWRDYNELPVLTKHETPGRRDPMKALCARCGTEIDPVTTFCTGCSAPVEGPQSWRKNRNWPPCPAPPTASTGRAGGGGGGAGDSSAGGGGKSDPDKGGGPSGRSSKPPISPNSRDIEPATRAELGAARLATGAPLADSYGDAPSGQGRSASVEGYRKSLPAGWSSSTLGDLNRRRRASQ
jgi:hypothetical protein